MLIVFMSVMSMMSESRVMSIWCSCLGFFVEELFGEGLLFMIFSVVG